MDWKPMGQTEMDGGAKLAEAGIDNGHTLKCLFSTPGMSLCYAWFKSGYPLPRHRHNADCVYYIVAGSLQFGSETLRAGEGFFIPADAPYAYTAGPDGLEILEFRTANSFDIEILAKNPAFWERAAQSTQARQAAWKNERPPSERAS